MSTPKTIINDINRIKTIEKDYSISELKENYDAIRRHQKSTKTSSVPDDYSKKNYLPIDHTWTLAQQLKSTKKRIISMWYQ